jgi:putative ABC transport system permease protein
MRELRYALRRLGRTPGFAVAVVLTLAIAIGSTSAVFGVVDGVLLKAFPYRDADRVLTLWESSPERQLPQFAVAPANFFDWQSQNKTFVSLACIRYIEGTVTGEGEPEHIIGFAATPSYFPTVGITPVLGRPLSSDSSGPPEVVLGYDYWARRFGQSPTVVGQTLRIDGHPYTIVGVAPSGVFLPGRTPVRADVWTRLTLSPTERSDRDHQYFLAFGRLRQGVSVDAGSRDLIEIARRLAQAYPRTNEHWSVLTIPVLDQLVGPIRPALLLLLAAAVCVLLIGAANLANLFLARCLARERELALRTALGAGRARLVRELLTEAAVLCLAAGVLAVLVAGIGVRVLRTLAPSVLPRLEQVHFDMRTLVFCAIVTVLTVLIFGALPAWQAARANLSDVLKHGGRGTASAQRKRMQSGLVALQVSMAFVLLVCAELFVKSFAHLEQMDPGFRADGVLTAQVVLPGERYSKAEQQIGFTTAVLEQLRAQPSVDAASASDAVPGIDTPIMQAAIVGGPQQSTTEIPMVQMVAVSPDYFHAMSIPLMRGRGIQPTDRSGGLKVGVIDELLARRFFQSRDPLGRRLWIKDSPDTIEIVGVVASVKQTGLTEDFAPELYTSLGQFPSGRMLVAVHSSGDPAMLARTLNQAIRRIDNTVPVFDVEPMTERIGQSIGVTRFATLLASVFAAVALTLGVIGVYSVLAYVVGQQQREFGVRLALGASPARLARLVLRQAIGLVAVGLAAGLLAAWAVTRGAGSLFVGVSSHDPGVFALGVLIFALVGTVGAAIPAIRASRVSPLAALASA